MRILITGGTGFIGKKLVKALTDAQHEVAVLTRSERTSNNRYLNYLEWDGTKMPLGIGLYDAVINLAGASIADGKWTEEYKAEIMSSRIEATRACVEYINRSPNPPKVFLSGSAVGYYGIEHDEMVDESSRPGSDFAAQVCQHWEEEAKKAKCRTVRMRIGLFMGEGGGALAQMLPIYKMYLGGRFASGKQGFPWVHVDDIVGAMLFFLENEATEGAYNLAGPEMLDQAAFSESLANALGTADPFFVPKFAIKLMFGEKAYLFYGGQQISVKKLETAGYAFEHPRLDAALKGLV